MELEPTFLSNIAQLLWWLIVQESTDSDQDPMLLKYHNSNYQAELSVRTCFSIYCLEQDKGIYIQDVLSRTCCWYHLNRGWITFI